MATIKDVANLAGVSPSTVSRVLADSPKISAKTKEAVRLAMKTLNYHPNALARGLVTKTASAIGILIPADMKEFFVNPFFSGLMSGLSEVASEAGFDIMLATKGADEDDILQRLIRGRRVDGVLLLRSRVDDPAIRELAKRRFPAVLLGRPDGDERIAYVDNDNVLAAYDATMHLIRLGHRKIGFLGGSGDLVVTRDRIAGYRKALAEAGIELDPRLQVSTELFERGGYLGMMRLLALSERPTAILASDDVLAFGAMQAAAELGYQLPDDLAVVGFNDIRLAELANPALTSVRVHMKDLGRAAMEMLIRQIREPEAERDRRIVGTELVVRYSCGARRPDGNLNTT